MGGPATRKLNDPFPHVAAAWRYAQDVLAGRVVACKWVKAACQRQLDDLQRAAEDPVWPFYFDDAAAERACDFIGRLRHVKGPLAGSTITLEPFQSFSLACVFGWKRLSGDPGRIDSRRFTTVYEEVARKNAKSTKVAGVGLKMLVDDDEFGAEVYSAATTRDQASYTFNIAKSMVRMDGDFRAHFGVQVFERSIVVRDQEAKFTALSGEGKSLDSLSVSCALVDELHAHKTRAVFDVLDSATGARSQPLIWQITTAGYNRAGICYDQRTYLTKILNTTLQRHDGLGYKVTGDATVDESFWGIIYTIDDDDDEFDERCWPKANPNLGVSVFLDAMRDKAQKARVQNAARTEFLTKRLNVWVNADSAWMDMRKWGQCRQLERTEESFKGQPCYIALDAAFKKDLFAKVKVFVDGRDYYAFGRYYMPETALSRSGFEQVAAWVEDGYIRTTAGEVLDIEAVREELIGSAACLKRGVEDHRLAGDVEGDIHRFDVKEIGYDPAQLTQFSSEMTAAGQIMVEIRPLVLNFSPAMKEIDELVAGGRFHHNGDPVLEWMISNVVCHKDVKDNIYPRRSSEHQKIDGAIALIMATSRAMTAVDDTIPAGYELTIA